MNPQFNSFYCRLSLFWLLLLSIESTANPICADLFRDDTIAGRSTSLPKFINAPEGTQFVTVFPAEELRGQDQSNPSLSTLLQDVRQETEKQFPQDAKNSAVLYLATGIDGGLTHAIQPNKFLHITVDDSPSFHPTQLSADKPLESYIGSVRAKWPFVMGGVHGVEGNFAGRDLVGNIIMNLPQAARIKSLTFIVPAKEYVKRVYGDKPSVQAVHFLLAYDHGEGTPVNYHWHISGVLPESPEALQNIWWFRNLKTLPINTITTKSNSGAIRKPVAKVLRDMVKANDGFVLDDDSLDLVDFEVDDYHSVRVNYGFGYGNHAHFSKPK